MPRAKGPCVRRFPAPSQFYEVEASRHPILGVPLTTFVSVLLYIGTILGAYTLFLQYTNTVSTFNVTEILALIPNDWPNSAESCKPLQPDSEYGDGAHHAI